MVYTMVKININYNKCPYCGTPYHTGATYCEHCNKRIPHSKLKMAKKLFKGSKVLIKSALSRKYREKTIQKTMGKMYGFDMKGFDQNIGNFNHKKSGDYGYLLCDSCPIYYVLDHPLNADDPRVCGCGGNLIYSDKSRHHE